MSQLSSADTLGVVMAAFLTGALFGRLVWRRRAYHARVQSASDVVRREAEERFRAVQDASPDGFALMRAVRDEGRIVDFEFVYLNPASQSVTARPPELLVGRRLGGEFPGTMASGFIDGYARVVETGDVFRYEHSYRRGGDPSWIAVTAIRIEDGVAVTFVDATARKQAEAMLAASHAELERRVAERTAELREAQERYRLLAEHASDMISTHSVDGAFMYAAPALEALLGAKTAELRGHLPMDYAFGDDAAILLDAYQRAVATQKIVTATWRCRRIDGGFVWLETSGRAVRDPETGRVTWFVCSSRDITARKRIEDALRESERRLRATLEAAHLVAVAVDTDGLITFCNDALCTLTGWTRNGLLGRNWFDVLSDSSADGRARFREHLLGGAVEARSESQIVCRDGTRRLVEWDSNVLRDPSGVVIGMVSLGVDVTEKRQEETALQLLQSISVSASTAEDFDSALSVSLASICDATGWQYGEVWMPSADRTRLERLDVCFTAPEVNAGAVHALRGGATALPDEELVGRAWTSGELAFDAGERADVRTVADEEMRRIGLRAAAAVPVRSGHDVVAVFSFYGNTGLVSDTRSAEVVAAVANQLGSLMLRKRAETQLRESETRLRAVVRSMNEGLLIIALDGRVQFANERALELLGAAEADVLGRDAGAVLGVGDAAQHAERVARRRAGLSDRYEAHCRLADGRTAWLEISGSPLANADGEIAGTLKILTDISARKRYEEALLRARDAAEAASRAKSGFLSRMSHELRTPLNSVIGFARVLRKNARGAFVDEDLKFLDRIQANGEHLLTLVNDLLDVAKIEAGRVDVHPERVHVDALVRTVVEQLEGQSRAPGVELRAEVPAHPVVAHTDPTLLRQILINLTGNALRFTHQGSVVVALHADGTGRPLRIDVIDTGIGIPEDRQRAIFEPFEQADSTTSRAYGGTGLGLAIARSLCATLGCELTLESAPDRGSRFSIRFEAVSATDHTTGAAA